MSRILNDKILFDKYEEIIPKDFILRDYNSKFSFYKAKELHCDISCKNLIYIDMVKAYPTLFNIYFYNEKDFINHINQLQDKKEKLIEIVKFLKNKEAKTNINYIREFNKRLKILLFLKIFTEYVKIDIYEYNKDGSVFTGIKNYKNNDWYLNILKSSNILFREERIDWYIHVNGITVLKKQQLQIRGVRNDSTKAKILKIFLETENNSDYNSPVVDRDDIQIINPFWYHKRLLGI